MLNQKLDQHKSIIISSVKLDPNNTHNIYMISYNAYMAYKNSLSEIVTVSRILPLLYLLKIWTKHFKAA